jgi:hypothetical protein
MTPESVCAVMRIAPIVMGVSVALSACSHSPSAPSPNSQLAQMPSAVPPAPAPFTHPLSPPNNATIPAAGLPVTLVAGDQPATGYAVVLDTFEVATDAAFTHKLATISVPQGGAEAGRTSFSLDYMITPQTYYWHVRAGSGETVGSFSETFAFTIGPGFNVNPPPSTGPLFADAPAQLSPAQGSLQNQHPTLVVRNASHSGPVGSNATFYEFLLSTTPQTVGNVACLTYESPLPWITENSCLLSGALSPGLYYWRARTVVGRRGFDTGVTSAVSAPWTFTVPPQVLQEPFPILPVQGANVHPRPTLTVRNAVHSGPVGALTYQFDVASEVSNPPSIVASGTVPEGATQTSWTVPFDLMIGASYAWHVKAIDTGSGATSPYSNYSTLTVLTGQATLYTLAIHFPPTCRYPAAFTIFASSLDAVGGGHFALTTDDDELRLDSTIAGRGISGTIGGSASVPAYYLTISASKDADAPASLSGIVGDDGRLSGTFNGFVKTSSSYATDVSCAASNFA